MKIKRGVNEKNYPYVVPRNKKQSINEILREKFWQHYSPKILRNVVLGFIWITVSILSTLYITIEDNEVTYELSILEGIYLVCSTLLLLTGLKKDKIEYLLPWIVFSAWNIYTQKYFALEHIFLTFYRAKYGMSAILLATLTLALKFALWYKVVCCILESP